MGLKQAGHMPSLTGNDSSGQQQHDTGTGKEGKKKSHRGDPQTSLPLHSNPDGQASPWGQELALAAGRHSRKETLRCWSFLGSRK
jgi:hypothetical protein